MNYKLASFLCFFPLPSSAFKGHLLGGIYWSFTPFSLATSLWRASTMYMFTISTGKTGLVPPAVADHLLREALGGSWS